MVNAVGTDKIKIGGYVPPELGKKFDDFAYKYAENNKSQAIEIIATVLLGLSEKELKALESWAIEENRTIGLQGLTIIQDEIRKYYPDASDPTEPPLNT